ncbi:MAG TPA: nucleotidyl transferase AbiEii/AbiGii toxin family protein [Salinivirga sp.]|uniref:nucleotidyl transferase AbiEii/AbiGii toxin family protein n=1 Tax=Salinivirga sp. TaxID=1970192 RepID=UPI002B46C54F|nr:nucleotidyl transferase AbiEii/AbiGii toxin family protein [Salinivirga sp.]HKK57979.1 nucleotidyl transferase AbiEii/AbiGii toxin family protein [Salinivirga sp.]
MLHKSAVKPELLRILDQVMQIDAFSDLRMVGGTALALQIGHRESIDIDLFGKIAFLEQEKNIELTGNVEVLKKSKNINVLSIDNIKVDIVNYKYPWISPLIEEDNYRLASIKDIGAMKLSAITGRGTKKDFIDLYYLLKMFSFDELFNFYSEKFDDGNLFLVKKSLAYFDDAEPEPMPVMKEKINWEEIKSQLQELMRKFL